MLKHPGQPRNTEETVEFTSEHSITLQQMMDRTEESGITVEETIEYPDNAGADTEEFADYTDSATLDRIFKRKIRAEPDNDDGSDDQDTPPRSNESFNIDMEDTWEDQAPELITLSPIVEEDSQQIRIEEQGDEEGGQQQNASLIGQGMHPFQDTHHEERMQESGVSPLKEFVNMTSQDSYYDYDTDDGLEISEATPDDDTATLDAKIDQLKGELISDVNLESYLSEIL